MHFLPDKSIYVLVALCLWLSFGLSFAVWFIQHIQIEDMNTCLAKNTDLIEKHEATQIVDENCNDQVVPRNKKPHSSSPLSDVGVVFSLEQTLELTSENLSYLSKQTNTQIFFSAFCSLSLLKP